MKSDYKNQNNEQTKREAEALREWYTKPRNEADIRWANNLMSQKETNTRK